MLFDCVYYLVARTRKLHRIRMSEGEITLLIYYVIKNHTKVLDSL